MNDLSMRSESGRPEQRSENQSTVASTLVDRGAATREMILAAGVAALLLVSGVWAAVSLLGWFWREVF